MATVAMAAEPRASPVCLSSLLPGVEWYKENNIAKIFMKNLIISKQ
jgi:hypothetical protein